MRKIDITFSRRVDRIRITPGILAAGTVLVMMITIVFYVLVMLEVL